MTLLPPALFDRFLKLPIVQNELARFSVDERSLRARAVKELEELRARRDQVLIPLLRERALAETAVAEAKRQLEQRKQVARDKTAAYANNALELDMEETRIRRALVQRQDWKIEDFARRCEKRIDELELSSPPTRIRGRDPQAMLEGRRPTTRIVADYAPIHSALTALRVARDRARELTFADPDLAENELTRLETELPALARLFPAQTHGG